MSWLCPVCNGLQAFSATCSRCASVSVEDNGRYNDFLGPYAPYREMDDLSMNNGLPDLVNESCAHLAACSACGAGFAVYVKGWPL